MSLSVHTTHESNACKALALVALVLCAGCRANPPPPPPDRSALSVLIRAEPKAGWRDFGAETSAYDIAEAGRGRAYETRNYRALENIVVWVEPSDPPGTLLNSAHLNLDIGRPSTTMHGSGLHDVWTISNSAPEALPVYALYESGNVVDLGTLAPGTQVTTTPQEPGLVRIMTDIRPDALAEVYVAPVPTAAAGRVQVATSGTKVIFNNLPTGPARVSCWHAALPGSGAEVVLMPGVTSNATLVVGVNLLPQIP